MRQELFQAVHVSRMNAYPHLIAVRAREYGFHVFQQGQQRCALFDQAVLHAGPAGSAKRAINDAFVDRNRCGKAVEVGIVCYSDSLDQDAGAQNVNEARRKAERKTVKSSEYLVCDFLNLALSQTPVEMDGYDGLRSLLNHGWTDVVLEHVEFVCHVDQFIDITSYSGDHNAHEILAKLRSNLQNHAIVQQHNS